MVHAEQLQDGGLQIVGCQTIDHSAVPKWVGFAKGHAAAHTAAGQPTAKPMSVMVATNRFRFAVVFRNRQPPDFLAGTYDAVGVRVTLPDGTVVTEKDFDEFAGRMTIDDSGFAEQMFKINGEDLFAEAQLWIIDDDTLLVDSPGANCRYKLGFTWNDPILVTMLSREEARRCLDTDAAEEDTWERVDAASAARSAEGAIDGKPGPFGGLGGL